MVTFKISLRQSSQGHAIAVARTVSRPADLRCGILRSGQDPGIGEVVGPTRCTASTDFCIVNEFAQRTSTDFCKLLVGFPELAHKAV